MPFPKFNADELYLINGVKSTSVVNVNRLYMWTYVISCIIMAGFAAYLGSIPMMGATFVVLCGFRIYEERDHMKWIPIWRSVIEKYEAAAVGNFRDDTDDL